jgi:Signal transduction histidine kinase
MKIQHRIALIFALLTMSIVLTVTLADYYIANQNTFEDFYKRLEIRAIVAARTQFEKENIASATYEELRNTHLETLPKEQEYFISVNNLNADIIASKLQLPDVFYNNAIQRGSAQHRDHNVFYYGYLYKQSTGNKLVIISARNEFIDSYLSTLKRTILLSIIITSIVSVMIGLWFSKFILMPVRMITHKMIEITPGRLHLRLPVNKGNDEIAHLAETFNLMLDRLEATFETQKNFISNASHELNTPLTAIIGESEYALSKQRSADDYVNSLSVIYSEAERLKKITSSLLHLAQTGYTGQQKDFAMVRIDEVVYTVKATVDNIIPGNQVFIDLGLMPEDESKLQVRGNEQLLELAITNIVLNGCKYSNNKPVSITIAATHTRVIVAIEDQGIGIPQHEIAFIYEPFFRASNTGKFNGYGIGLPLSRNIVRMHHGELEVTSEENAGTKVRILLPLASAVDVKVV